MTPAGFLWIVLLFLGFHTLRMLPFINLDLALLLHFWLLDHLKRLERKIDDLEMDDE